MSSSYTWNPADAAAAIAFSNGNRTASGTGAGSNQIARGTSSLAAGKWYWTITVVGGANVGNIGIGIANGSEALAGSDYLGNNVNAVGLFNGGFWDYNFFHSAAPQLTDTHTYGFAGDFDNKLLWVEDVTAAPGVWNSGGTDNPGTGSGGFDFGTAHPITGPWYVAVSLFQTGDSVTLFQVPNTPPAGFTPLDMAFDGALQSYYDYQYPKLEVQGY